MKLLLVIVLLAGGTGCMVPTFITKKVTIERAPDGSVLKRIEEETVTQQVEGQRIQLELIKIPEPAKSSDGYPPSRAGVR